MNKQQQFLNFMMLMAFPSSIFSSQSQHDQKKDDAEIVMHLNSVVQKLSVSSEWDDSPDATPAVQDSLKKRINNVRKKFLSHEEDLLLSNQEITKLPIKTIIPTFSSNCDHQLLCICDGNKLDKNSKE